MCLSSISRKRAPEKGVGWKIFDVKLRSHWPRFMYFGIGGKNNTPIPFDKWIKAEKRPVGRRFGKPYVSGFHIYLKKPPWGHPTKVQFRGGRILGKDGRYACVVADEIKVTTAEWERTTRRWK